MNNNMDEAEVQFLTEKDQLVIINSLSDDIILDVIKEKINSVYKPHSDSAINDSYITIFETKYSYLNDKYSEYPEIISRIKEVRETVYKELLSALQDKFLFEIDLDTLPLNYNLYDIVLNLYVFFVVNTKENCINLVENYINSEKQSLLQFYKDAIDDNDLTYNIIKDKYSKETVTLITKLPSILSNIQFRSSEDLIDTIISDDVNETTNKYISELFSLDSVQTSGTMFVDEFLSKGIFENDLIFLEVRVRLMNKEGAVQL